MNSVPEIRRTSNIDNANVPANGSFHLIVGNEGFWWPYRSVGLVLFQMQRDRALVLAIRRQTIDGAATIERLEKDIILKLSANVLECATGSPPTPPDYGPPPPPY